MCRVGIVVHSAVSGAGDVVGLVTTWNLYSHDFEEEHWGSCKQFNWKMYDRIGLSNNIKSNYSNYLPSILSLVARSSPSFPTVFPDKSNLR